MSAVLWICQMVLACVFLYAGFSKIFAFERQRRMPPARPGLAYSGLPDEWAAAVTLVEIAFAVLVVLPFDLWPPYVLVRVAATGLALLAVCAGVYHVRRKEHAAPIIALFLLALFVIVGRWP